MKAVVDASSLLLLVKHVDSERLVRLAEDMTVPDFAGYEVNNAIWKQAHLLKTMDRDDAYAIQSAVVGLLPRVSLLRVDSQDPRQVLNLAFDRSISYYDASYLESAKRLKIGLATEDKRLRKAAAGLVDVISWREFSGA